jgi:signal recognition particle subunit SRP72
MEGGEQQTTFPLVFGKAYALYRLSREPEAHDIVQNIKPEGENQERGVMHMKAQIVRHISFQIL